MQHLYRHYDSDGNLLYVGVSLHAIHRLIGHKAASHWFHNISRVEIESFPDRESALEAERKAIINEKPSYNIQHSLPYGLIERMMEESKDGIFREVTQFKPVYDTLEAANLLGISETILKRLIADKKIGYVDLTESVNDGKTRPQIRITGWQIIEYLEHLQDKSGKD